MSPVLYNRRTDSVPELAVYIGRGSPWGNPFTVEEYGRDEAIRLFEEKQVPKIGVQKIVKILRGRDLTCHCVPLRCHGGVLLRIANS